MKTAGKSLTALRLRRVTDASGSLSIQALMVTGVRASSGALALLVAAVVAANYGASANGLVFVALAVIAIASTVGHLGLPEVALRHLAIARARGDRQSIRRLVRNTLFPALLWSTGCAVVTYFVFRAASADVASTVVLIAIPAATIVTLCSRSMVGLGRPLAAELTGKWLVQGALLGAVIAAAGVGADARALPVLILAAYLVAASVGLLLLWRIASRVTGDRGAADSQSAPGVRQLLPQALPLMVTAAIATLPQWLDILMLQAFLGESAVGVYGVATRLAALVGLVMAGANAIAAPRFAQLYADGDLPELRRLASVINTWTIMSALILVILVNVAAFWLEPLLGDSFRGAGWILLVASVGQLVHVSFGLVVLLLMMTGNGRPVLLTSVVAVAANAAVNLVLIPRLGAIGAAWASMAAILMANSLAGYLVWRRLGIKPMTFRLR